MFFGDFSFLAFLKHLLGNMFFFLGFLCKSKKTVAVWEALKTSFHRGLSSVL